MNKLAAESLRKEDTLESPKMENAAEQLGKLGQEHCQLGQVKADQWSFWGSQDTKQKVIRQGISGLFHKLNIFSRSNPHRQYVRNGGRILENVSDLTIFTAVEMKKITKDYSEEYLLDKGSFGKVYKGTLRGGIMVTVASVTVNEATHDVFTEGVEINIRMAHKNILQLIGCCLQVDVPLLVYEFVDNRSLQDILHASKQELPLDLRLDIGIGSAQGLSNIHLYVPRPLWHGDIKPDNILLTEMLTPKLSGFGLLKEHLNMTVAGSMSHTDPMSLITGFLTQKSDVYSFGVVLLEIITRKQSIYDEHCSLVLEFSKVYETEKSGRTMLDREIATEENMFCLEEIGKLAIECLQEQVEHRPDMTDIAERLMTIRRDIGIRLRKQTKSEGEANWPS